MPTNVLLTGAFGRVGTAIIDNLADREAYDFTYLDREPHPEYDAVVADVADADAIRPAFEGQDAVVHLAGNPHTSAEWPEVRESNVEGTYNVFDAACDAGVESVLFASTNHVQGLSRQEREPDLYDEPSGPVVDESDPVRPNSLYAVSKSFGEDLGRYYVECEPAPARFYAFRIGWLLDREDDSPYGPAERRVAEGRIERGSEEYERLVTVCKGMWCSRRDMAQLVDLALEDESVTWEVFNARSAGDRGWQSIEKAREVLGYEPQDDAEAVEPPG